MEYINYHKHTHKSNVRTIDCIVKPIDYINRAKELNHNYYSVVEHGWAGNFLEDYELCKKNNINMIYGSELYIVKDRFEKDSSNAHIILISKNKEAFYQLNKIMSESNKTGFYYKNRVDLELISQLDPDLFFCTTACIGGFASMKYDSEIFDFVRKHFKNTLYLETQSHVDKSQAIHNKHMLNLAKKYNLPIIHANDSHYIYPEQAKDRDLFLKGKGMKYEDESGLLLDYPSYNDICDRYEKQGILNKKEVKQALSNTLIFKQCEDLKFNKEIKMPNPFKEDTKKLFKTVIAKKWIEERKNIPQYEQKEYLQPIKEECDIVLKTQMQNYFLINEKIIDIAINKYGGVLTKTGRGSAVAFYINKLLGFTEVDRLKAEVPLYPTRFMSVSRILETKSLPDIDFNTADPYPFIEASRDVLGQDNAYFMIALGTMQESEAFRSLCRAYGFEMSEFNDVAKDLDLYRSNPRWGKIIEESQKFVGVIDSVSPSPCAVLLLQEPISEEMGIININNVLCACIDGLTADKWKYLKNDFLKVSVWKIISNTFKKIGIPTPNIEELKSMLDDKVWNLYRDGITATLNQIDSEFATGLMKRYCAKNVMELTAFISAIRPSFASLLDDFLDRKEYSTGIPEVDELLKNSFGRILYQENIMGFLTWCGIEEDSTYSIIKKIAKKIFPEEELATLKKSLFENFSKKVSEPEKFDDIWQVIEDAVRYSFNSAHALSVAWDSLYGAYLKANYPFEYYSEILDHYINNTKKTGKIIKELDYFNIKIENIKFRKSIDKYNYDKKLRTIYKGIESIKYCNSKIALELYGLRNNKYNNFIELLADIKEKTSTDSRQRGILTTLGFFEEFGYNKKLLGQIELFDKFYYRKQINKKDLDDLGLSESIISKYSNKITKALYKELDTMGLVKELSSKLENKKLNIKEVLSKEFEYLEYFITIIPEAKGYVYVKEFKTYQNKCKPYLILYDISTGEEIKAKVIDEELYITNPFKEGNVLKIKIKERKRNKRINGKWVKVDEMENILVEWEAF